MLRSPGVRALGRLTRLLLAPQAARFERDLARPAAAQDALLADLVADLARTGYGRRHGLRPGDGYATFRARLPVAPWEALAPWAEAQAAREDGALAPGRVRWYQPTSGSTGPAKAIPYTDALLASFGRMFALWLHDLLRHGPPLRSGRTWASVSPALGPRPRTARGVPVGVDDDRAYLAGWLRALVGPFLVVPAAASRLRDPEAFKHVAALLLLAAEPEIVSVWNPTLLAVLLDHARAHRDALARDWAAGGTARDGVRIRVPRPPPGRLAALAHDPPDWAALLPRLRLVSCWTEAGARPGADALRRRLPGVPLQGKGLLATEAAVTVPWSPAGGCVPLVRDVFLEFEDAAGAVGRLHEVEPGETYSLLLTQRGGLARYRIGDRVRVTHRYRGTPCLAFAGREGALADLCGEKLHEAVVARALEALALPPGAFRTLLPVRHPDGRGHYALLVDRLDEPPAAAAGRLDASLQAAHRYREARLLGQLDPARVHVAPDAAERVLRHAAAAGRRLGDVKPAALGPEVPAGSPLVAA